MSLVVIGFNHKSTAISLREKLACSLEEQAQVMQYLSKHSIVSGVMVLSTCNRFEIICTTSNSENVFETYAKIIDIKSESLQNHVYYYKDEQAFSHILRVAAGLDSMLIGETQIFGQLKSSFNFAKKNNFLDKDLFNILPKVFHVAKSLRSKNNIVSKSYCYANTIINLAKSVFKLPGKNILFLGSGDMINSVATHFIKQNFGKMFIASRTYDNAVKLADKFGLSPIYMKDINSKLSQVDIVIAAISSPLPLIGKGMIETALRTKSNQPLLLIDLGVPRNIEPEAQTIAGAYIYNIDNLQDIIDVEMQNRQEAILAAEDMLQIEAKQCYNSYKVSSTVNVVRDFRGHVEKLRDEVSNDALNALSQGKNPADVVNDALRQFSQKVLHKPTVNIRKAIAGRRADILQLTKDFFELSGK
jgi:glutamyl-tRNA reductase